ncbi:unnamed protein product [Effrenium voratum]|nr:unnamed protein product [Effrenium voratum]
MDEKSRWERTVYMGNLPDDIREQDIVYILQDFGQINDIDIKQAPHGVTYAFVEFRNAADAKDAALRRDGFDFEGEPLRVEIKDGFKGKGKSKGYGKSNQKTGDDEFCLEISGLPEGTLWTQLKDHMRQAGDVLYCDIFHHGRAQVRFNGYAGAKRAVETLDGSSFQGSHRIRVWWSQRRRDWDDRGSPRSRSRR